MAALCGQVSGRVQGVGFRRFVQLRAEQLGVHGWVRNCSDGSVAFHLEGEESALQAMLVVLHQGPPGSRVLRLTQTPAGEQGYCGFSILADS